MVVDGSDLQVDTLTAAEGPLSDGQPLVGRHRLFGIHLLGGQVGANHIDSVQCRLLFDALLLALVGEGLLADIQDKMLAHFVAVEDFAHPQGNPILALEATFGASGRLDNLLQLHLGSLEQLLAIASPFLC